ncbi:MAG: polysaccharide biosynthesis C-terminal domain-containing protein [Myxococcota bacterium]
MKDLRLRLQGDGVGATVARGASAAFMVRIAAMLVGFGLNVVLARVLGATAYGTYVLALSWLLLVAMVSQLGLRDSIVRFGAAAYGQRAWSELAGIFFFSNRWTLAVSLFSVAVFGGTLWVLSDRLAPTLLHTLSMGLFLIPLVGFVGVKSAMLLALARPALATFLELVSRPAVILVGIAGAYFISEGGLSPVFAMGVTVGASAFSLLLCIFFLSRAIPADVGITTPDLEHRSEWRTVALSLFLLAAMILINNRADMLMIGGMLGTTEVGFYSAANRYAQFIPFPLYAVNSLAAPMIARLFAEGRRREIQRVVSLGALGIGCMAIPAAILLIVAGRPLLGIYGAEFVEGYAALVWLTIGQLATAMGGSVTQLMTMTGHHRSAARIVGASAILNLTLNFILIPRYGIAGAGIATAASVVLANLGMVLFVRRRLGFDPTLFSFIRRKAVDESASHSD